MEKFLSTFLSILFGAILLYLMGLGLTIFTSWIWNLAMNKIYGRGGY